MHISRLAPDTWPDAMQPVGRTPAGTRPAFPPSPEPFAPSALSAPLEVVVLLTMSAVASLMLCLVAAGAF